MSRARVAAVAAVAGAAGMLAVSGVPVQVFLLLAEVMEELPATGSLTGQMLFGAACAALLAAGIVGVAWCLIQPTGVARIALVCAALSFGLALVSIGWGNTQVARAFSRLARSETVQPEPFVRGCQSGLLPMRIGYASVLAASGLVLAAVFATPARKDRRRSPLGAVALIVSVLASLLLVTGNVFAALHTQRLHGLLASETPVEPVELATSLSSIVFSVYAVSLALAGLGLACLLLALAQGRPVAED
jgi:hypothetical protein